MREVRRCAGGEHWGNPAAGYRYEHYDPTEMREKCGTYAGWNQHMKRGEPVCDACRHANSNYILAYRKRTSTKCTPGLGWPIRSRV
jgi:hypothetical protein